jgi:hypothetical protein
VLSGIFASYECTISHFAPSLRRSLYPSHRTYIRSLQYWCRCNREQRRCSSKPKRTGTPCGTDGDYEFGQCNQGPGFCRTLESSFGSMGICVGIPSFGATCDDGRQCTTNDRCKVVVTGDRLIRGVCEGEFEADLPCDDGDNLCTINDRYFCCSS